MSLELTVSERREFTSLDQDSGTYFVSELVFWLQSFCLGVVNVVVVY